GTGRIAWGLPVLAVALVWSPQAMRPVPQGRARPAGPGGSLLRQPLAWQVTGFMGLQSALAYCIFGWFAPLLRARGLDAATAGYVVSFSVLVQTAACLLAPGLATRRRHQGPFNVAVVALAVIGFLGALFAPLSTVWIWAAIQGAGQGSLIAVGLLVIVLRAPDAATAARLSSMAQGFGYTVAAFGPLVMGALFTTTGRPGATAPLILLIGAGAALSGWFAGRDRVLPLA
ncbi:cyanate transporter, partial [Lichenihabitans sp. Uapishka_5]|nr:cyanate transporter [Lichenihabitans sp. Uapishka_5]